MDRRRLIVREDREDPALVRLPEPDGTEEQGSAGPGPVQSSEEGVVIG
jgi:hypothetical protein